MKKPRVVLPLVFLTVFLDIVGFSILFPLFPEMLRLYLENEGAASGIGRLAAWLEELAGGRGYAVVPLFGGILGSVYSLLQFLFAPLWGGLSDRFGRRPTLLLTLFGTLAAQLLWVFAGSFLLLVLSRILGGIMAGNISTATAVVADTTREEERAKGMGIVGMAIGLGFIFGPVIAALAFSIPLCQEEVWESGFALNRFSVAASAAALLAAFNLLWVMARLPETLRPGEVSNERRAGLLRLMRHLRHLNAPGLPRTNLAYFLYMSAFAAMEFTLVFLAVERLDYRPRDNTWMFVFVGLIIAGVQGGAIRRVVPRYGERKVTLFGLAILIPGFVLVGLAQGSGMLYAGLAFMAVGSALVMPCLSALASRYAPPEAQGLVLGTLRSMGSLSRAVGPLVGGLLYWRFGSALPYYLAALFLLLPLFLAIGLPRAERGSIAGRQAP